MSTSRGSVRSGVRRPENGGNRIRGADTEAASRPRGRHSRQPWMCPSAHPPWNSCGCPKALTALPGGSLIQSGFAATPPVVPFFTGEKWNKRPAWPFERRRDGRRWKNRGDSTAKNSRNVPFLDLKMEHMDAENACVSTLFENVAKCAIFENKNGTAQILAAQWIQVFCSIVPLLFIKIILKIKNYVQSMNDDYNKKFFSSKTEQWNKSIL